MKILSLINAQQHHEQSIILRGKYRLLHGLLGNTLRKHKHNTIKLFVISTELFGSTFSNFELNDDTYYFGNVKTVGIHVQDIQAWLRLQRQYVIEYYILNSTSNFPQHIPVPVVNKTVEYIEMHVQPAIEAYYDTERQYIMALAGYNQNVYKGMRLHTASENLDNKIKLEKYQKFKMIQNKRSAQTSLLEVK